MNLLKNRNKKEEKNIEILNNKGTSYLKKCIKDKNYIYKPTSMDFDKYIEYIEEKNFRSLINEISNDLASLKFYRKICFEYSSYYTYSSTGEKKTNIKTINFIIDKIDGFSDEAIFLKKIDSFEDINNILNFPKHRLFTRYIENSFNFKDFFHINNKDINIENIKKSIIENKINDGFIDFKKSIFEKIRELDFGYLFKDSLGVTQKEVFYFCDKETFKYNIKFLYLFLEKLYMFVLRRIGNESLNEKRFILSSKDFNVEYIPEILEEGQLVAMLIAFNSKYCLQADKYACKFNEIAIIKRALDIDCSCYAFLPEKYRFNEEVMKHLIERHINCLGLLINNGPYNKEKWKNICIKILEKDDLYE